MAGQGKRSWGTRPYPVTFIIVPLVLQVAERAPECGGSYARRGGDL